MYKFEGIHILSDIKNIDSDILTDIKKIKGIVKEGINQSKSTILDYSEHLFPNNGFTFIFLLEESHVSIHTYPEHNSLFFDAFTCGTIDPSIIHSFLIDNLNKDLIYNIKKIKRGEF